MKSLDRGSWPKLHVIAGVFPALLAENDLLEAPLGFALRDIRLGVVRL